MVQINMCIHIYTYMYICMSIYIYSPRMTHTSVFISNFLCLYCRRTYTYIYMYTHTNNIPHTHTHTHTDTAIAGAAHGVSARWGQPPLRAHGTWRSAGWLAAQSGSYLYTLGPKVGIMVMQACNEIRLRNRVWYGCWDLLPSWHSNWTLQAREPAIYVLGC